MVSVPTDPSHPAVLDEETLDLLRRKNEIDQQLLSLAKTDGIALYRPHYLQHKFHSSPAKRRGVFTGNRFGKSKSDGAETAAWMRGERTWYKAAFDIYGVDYDIDPKTGDWSNRRRVLRASHPGGEDHPLVRQGIPPYATKQLIVCSNWNKVEEIWTSLAADRPGYMWQFLPKGWAKGYTNHAGVISQIVGKNGSVVDFLSVDAYKKNPMVAESSDYDRIVFDEPGPQSLWKGLARGLVDRGGQADFALTSLSEIWIPNKFDDTIDPSGDADDNKPFRDKFSFRASMLDNPHLSDQDIRDFENELSEDERQTRLHGVPLEMSGLVYKTFSKAKHVLKDLPLGWTDWHLPHKSCILHCRVDTHPVNPHAVLFAAVGPSEIPIICHEIYKACDADTLCQEINAYVKLTGCFLGSLKVEPAAWNPDPATRTAPIASYFFKHGLFPQKAVKDLSTGILIVKGKLANSQVFFVPTLKRVFWEFVRYRIDPETGKPVDKDDHMMENLYRMLSSRLNWFDPDTAAGEAVPDHDLDRADLSVPNN